MFHPLGGTTTAAMTPVRDLNEQVTPDPVVFFKLEAANSVV
jgi:hypothetical protein